MDHWFTYGGLYPADSHQHFTFTAPPGILTPGTTVNLTVTGTSTSSPPGISGEIFRYSADGVTLEGAMRLNVGSINGDVPQTATVSFLVPEVSSEKITITASMITALGVSADGFSVQWVYATEAPEGMHIDLTHYNPFDYFKTFDYQNPGTAADIAPAGDLVARVTDEDGNPVAGEVGYFYAVKELNPDQFEPGKNLRGILKPLERNEEDQASYEIPLHVIYQALDIDQETYLDYVYTDANGEAQVNYLNIWNFDHEAFAQALQAQTAIHNIGDREGGSFQPTLSTIPTAWQPGVQPPGSDASGLWYFVGAGAAFVLMIVLLVWRRKERS